MPDEMPRFITNKQVEVHHHLGNLENSKPNKQIRFKTSVLRSDLCDFSDAYIVVKGTMTLTKTNGREIIDIRNRFLAFKNNAPFTNCISKINNVLIDNAEDLDVAMPMYNLIEYSKNYRKTTGSLQNFYRDGLTGDRNNNNFPNKNVINSESFKYRTSATVSTYNVDAKITNQKGNEINNSAYDRNKSGKKEVEIAVPLKYLSNFWRALKMQLINCQVSLSILIWSRECVITSMEKRVITNTQRDTSLANATFQTDAKLYVPVFALSTENDKTLLEQLRTGFKRTIKWNKYRSEMTNQTKNNNLNYLIDLTFTKVNRFFILSFENENNRTSFSKYYVLNVKIEGLKVLIDGKSLFDMPITNDEEKYEQFIEMGRNSDYATGNLLDYEYFSEHYK